MSSSVDLVIYVGTIPSGQCLPNLGGHCYSSSKSEHKLHCRYFHISSHSSVVSGSRSIPFPVGIRSSLGVLSECLLLHLCWGRERPVTHVKTAWTRVYARLIARPVLSLYRKLQGIPPIMLSMFAEQAAKTNQIRPLRAWFR